MGYISDDTMDLIDASMSFPNADLGALLKQKCVP